MLYGILFRMPSCRFMANGRSEWECRGQRTTPASPRPMATSTKLTIPTGVAPSIAKSFWKGREGASLFLGHRAWLVH
jgi:hypothetical protein